MGPAAATAAAAGDRAGPVAGGGARAGDAGVEAESRAPAREELFAGCDSLRAGSVSAAAAAAEGGFGAGAARLAAAGAGNDVLMAEDWCA